MQRLFATLTLLLALLAGGHAATAALADEPYPPYQGPEALEAYPRGEINLYRDYGWDILPKLGGTFLLIATILVILYFYRSTRIVMQWAAQNHFRVVSIKLPINPGPLWSHTAWPHFQIIYYATVQTPFGLQSAWVLCGNRWLGVFSDHVVVEWDDADADSRLGIRMPFVSRRRG